MQSLMIHQKHCRWNGKRFICLVRQPNDAQGNDSVRTQLEFLRVECEKRGMTFVDQVVLERVSESKPGERTDLDELSRRKRERDDYDVLVVQKNDRLTRGGATHAAWIKYEFAKLGVELFFPGEDQIDSQDANLIHSIKFDGAKDLTSSLSQRSTQGRGQALQEGRHAPFPTSHSGAGGCLVRRMVTPSSTSAT